MTPDNVLFYHATFLNGHQISQDQSDSSSLGLANTFSDVLHYQKEIGLKSFVLTDSVDAPTWRYAVDLADGHFETGVSPNMTPFFCHRFDQLEGTFQESFTNIRVIYVRTPQIDVMGQEGPRVGYSIGWQANDSAGKNVQHILKTPFFEATEG